MHDRPRLQLKVEVTHDDDHDYVEDEYLKSMIGREYVDDVRISPGYSVSAVFVTFKPGKYFIDRVERLAEWTATHLESAGYADDVAVNRTWVTATDA